MVVALLALAPLAHPVAALALPEPGYRGRAVALEALFAGAASLFAARVVHGPTARVVPEFLLLGRVDGGPSGLVRVPPHRDKRDP